MLVESKPDAKLGRDGNSLKTKRSHPQANDDNWQAVSNQRMYRLQKEKIYCHLTDAVAVTGSHIT